MDLFKFIPRVDHETVLENGQPINDIVSSMWVERYRTPGEFEIKARLSSGLSEFLPVGTFIGNVQSLEVMMVENHEIDENKDEDAIITISGRTFFGYLENRNISVEFIPLSNQLSGSQVTINYDYTWKQIFTSILYPVLFSGKGGTLENIYANWSILDANTGPGVKENRVLDSDDSVLDFILSVLPIDDLGFRTIRKNSFGMSDYTGPLGDDDYTYFNTYLGANKTAEVVFSWARGDIASASYLLSNKNSKNACLVTASRHQILVTPPELNYKRRFMSIVARDIDSGYDAFPSDPIKSNILAVMATRGKQAIANNNNIFLNRLDISDTINYVFRRDYNLGDLVMIEANFGISQVMRVIEHVEIEDENGRTNHPTLGLPLNRSRI